MYTLKRDQIEQLVDVIRDEYGDRLNRAEFNDRMVELFENIPGFETLPRSTERARLKQLWTAYVSVVSRE